MVRRCVVCGEPQKRNSKYSFHRFPKSEAQRRQAWAKVCALDKRITDIDDGKLICCKHFRDCDYDPSVWPARKLLPNAIPSPSLIHQAILDESQIKELIQSEARLSPVPNTHQVVLNTSQVKAEVKLEIRPSPGSDMLLSRTNIHQTISNTPQIKEEAPEVIEAGPSPASDMLLSRSNIYQAISNTPQIKEEAPEVIEARPPPASDMLLSRSNIHQAISNTPQIKGEPPEEIETESSPASDMRLSTTYDTHDYSGKEDIFEEMVVSPLRPVRYVGDLTPKHFSTPHEAKMHLSFIQNEIELQRKKVKVLNVQKKRLEDKITSVKDLVEHLIENKLISEEASNALMIHIKL